MNIVSKKKIYITEWVYVSMARYDVLIKIKEREIDLVTKRKYYDFKSEGFRNDDEDFVDSALRSVIVKKPIDAVLGVFEHQKGEPFYNEYVPNYNERIEKLKNEKPLFTIHAIVYPPFPTVKKIQ